MNLIEQQNILRGLADDALKNEMGGNVPPYLVLAEVNRRKSARERYEAANAKYRANQPTVAEELMGQMPQAGIDTALTGGMRSPGPMAMPAGIDAAMPQPQPQAFADGGVVGYADGGIADLVSAYNARLSSTDEDRKNAQKMALMNIGAQIMAGRSRNTLSNVGSGLSAALPSYQQSMERLNTQEMQGLRDQIDLARQMEQDRLAQANVDRQMEQSQPESVIARKRAEWIAAGRDPSEPAFQNWALGLTTAEAAPTPEQEVELKRRAWLSSGGDPDDIAGFQEYALGIKPERPSASTEKRIVELNDKIIAGEGANKLLDEALDLNTKSFDNLWAEPAANVMGMFGDQTAKNTIQLKNATIGLALEQLRSTFGAMPTEGERQVLIEFQGSVGQPRDVRRAIYDRAKEKVALRVEMNRREAEALARGEKFSAYDALQEYEKAQAESAAPSTGETTGGTTTTDIPWSR